MEPMRVALGNNITHRHLFIWTGAVAFRWQYPLEQTSQPFLRECNPHSRGSVKKNLETEFERSYTDYLSRGSNYGFSGEHR